MISSTVTGNLIAAKTATFIDDKQQEILYGKIQMMTKDMSGDFYSLVNIKVKSERFNDLAPLAKQYEGKQITLNLTQQNYNGKVSYYFDSVVKNS